MTLTTTARQSPAQAFDGTRYWVALETDELGLMVVAEAWPASETEAANVYKAAHPEVTVTDGWSAWEVGQVACGSARLNRWSVSDRGNIVGRFSDKAHAEFQLGLAKRNSNHPDDFVLEFLPYAV